VGGGGGFFCVVFFFFFFCFVVFYFFSGFFFCFFCFPVFLVVFCCLFFLLFFFFVFFLFFFFLLTHLTSLPTFAVYTHPPVAGSTSAQAWSPFVNTPGPRRLAAFLRVAVAGPRRGRGQPGVDQFSASTDDSDFTGCCDWAYGRVRASSNFRQTLPTKSFPSRTTCSRSSSQPRLLVPGVPQARVRDPRLSTAPWNPGAFFSAIALAKELQLLSGTSFPCGFQFPGRPGAAVPWGPSRSCFFRRPTACADKFPAYTTAVARPPRDSAPEQPSFGGSRAATALSLQWAKQHPRPRTHAFFLRDP